MSAMIIIAVVGGFIILGLLGLAGNLYKQKEDITDVLASCIIVATLILTVIMLVVLVKIRPGA
jgi:hypothetical protein